MTQLLMPGLGSTLCMDGSTSVCKGSPDLLAVRPPHSHGRAYTDTLATIPPPSGSGHTPSTSIRVRTKPHPTHQIHPYPTAPDHTTPQLTMLRNITTDHHHIAHHRATEPVTTQAKKNNIRPD